MPSGSATAWLIIAWSYTPFRSSETLTRRLRIICRISGLLAAILLCYPPHLLHRLLGRGPSPWVGHYLKLAGRSAGLRIREEGTPIRAPVLYVPNHVSWLDILVLGGAQGSAFVAKDEVASWPVLGWLARLGGTVFVERADRRSAGSQALRLAQALTGGRPVTLFAEGTTGDGVGVRTFRPTLLAAVANTSVPVQPVALCYDAPDEVFWPEAEPAGPNALRLLGSRGRKGVTVKYLAPIAAKDLDRKAIAALAQADVAAALTG